MGTNGRTTAIRAQMLLLETLISAEQIRAPAGAMIDGKKIGGRWIDKDTPYTLATTPGGLPGAASEPAVDPKTFANAKEFALYAGALAKKNVKLTREALASVPDIAAGERRNAEAVLDEVEKAVEAVQKVSIEDVEPNPDLGPKGFFRRTADLVNAVATPRAAIAGYSGTMGAFAAVVAGLLIATPAAATVGLPAIALSAACSFGAGFATHQSYSAGKQLFDEDLWEWLDSDPEGRFSADMAMEEAIADKFAIPQELVGTPEGSRARAAVRAARKSFVKASETVLKTVEPAIDAEIRDAAAEGDQEKKDRAEKRKGQVEKIRAANDRTMADVQAEEAQSSTLTGRVVGVAKRVKADAATMKGWVAGSADISDQEREDAGRVIDDLAAVAAGVESALESGSDEELVFFGSDQTPTQSLLEAGVFAAAGAGVEGVPSRLEESTVPASTGLGVLVVAKDVPKIKSAAPDGTPFGAEWEESARAIGAAGKSVLKAMPKPEKEDLVEQVAPEPQINLSLTTQAEIDEAIAADGERTKSIIEKVMDGFGAAKDAAIRGVDMAVGALTGTDFSSEDAAEAVKSKIGEIAEQAKLVGQQDLGYVLMGAATSTVVATGLLSTRAGLRARLGGVEVTSAWDGKLLKASAQALLGLSTPEFYGGWFGLNFLVASAFAIHDRMAEKSKLEELTGADPTEVLTTRKDISEKIEKSLKSRRKDVEAKMVESLKSQILGSVESISALEKAMGDGDPKVLRRKAIAIINKLTRGLKVKDLERHYGLDLAAVRDEAIKEAIAEIGKRIEETPEV